jgi:hypothetical protein
VPDSIGAWLDVYRLPKGRREHAQHKIQGRAKKWGWKELEEHCQSAVLQEQNLRDMNRRYRVQRNKPANPRLGELDADIDSFVGSIYRSGKDKSKNFAGEPIGQAADRLLEMAYPGGAGEVTHLEHIEQHKEVAGMIRLFEGDLADEIRTLGLQPEVNKVRAKNNEFGEILEREKTGLITPDQLRAAEEQGHELLYQTVVMILGHFYSQSKEHTKARSYLLEPIEEQEAAIGASYRLHRPVKDIDPKTGKEIVEEVEETKEPEDKTPAETKPDDTKPDDTKPPEDIEPDEKTPEDTGA